MIKVNATHEYDHDVETVYALFRDPDYYVEKFEAIGNRNVEVLECSDEDDEDFSIVVAREVRASTAPAILRSLVGEWTRLTQSENWQGEDGEYYNEIDVEAEGAPVTIATTMNLTATDDGCVNDIEVTIRSGVPLVGKKLEEFVAGDTEESLEAEYEFTQEYLDQR